MWWILASLAALALWFFWPTRRRRLKVQFHFASLAAQRRDWTGMAAKPGNIDVTRYQFHLATAQRELGRVAESLDTLRRACQTAESDFGAGHPRVSRARQCLEQAGQAAHGA